jgi:hypothetical protein
MIMRFVPYIGALLSAVFPLILAAAVGPGWQMLILTATLFVVLEFFAGHVLQPLVFGHSSGLSPVAIVLSASFWTWLWGPVGLVLATPLTVCLVVLGRHVDRLQFLDVMLGDRPPLTPSQLAYQRMLAGDPIEALEQAHEHLKTASIENYYDAILLNGLRLAEADRQLGHLDEDRIKRIVSTVEELIAELEAYHDAASTESSTPDLSFSPGAVIAIEQERSRHGLIPEPKTSPPSVVCIPGVGPLDETTALVLAQLLRHRGIEAIAERANALSMSRSSSLEFTDRALACVCYLSQPSTAKVQHTVRGLGKRIDATRVLLVLLGTESKSSVESTSNALVTSGSFGAALDAIARITAGQPLDESDRVQSAASS